MVLACSDMAVRKKAAKSGWAQDLTARVKERVRAELVDERPAIEPEWATNNREALRAAMRKRGIRGERRSA